MNSDANLSGGCRVRVENGSLDGLRLIQFPGL